MCEERVARVLIVKLLIAHRHCATAIKESREAARDIARFNLFAYLSVHFFFFFLHYPLDLVLVKGLFNTVALFLSVGYHSHLILDVERRFCEERKKDLTIFRRKKKNRRIVFYKNICTYVCCIHTYYRRLLTRKILRQ